MGAEMATDEGRDQRRSLPVRLVVWGFAVAALSLVVGGVAGNSHAVFEFFVPAMVGIVVATAVRVTGRLFVPAAVAGFLGLAIALLTSELGHPESYPNFVPALLRVAGTAIAFAGAVAGIVQRRRGTLRRPTSRQRTVAIAVAVLIVFASVGSVVLTSTSRTTVRNADGAIEVVTEGDEFVPNEFTLESDERVRFLVRNTDSYAHTFTVDDIAVDTYVGPHSERLVDVRVDLADDVTAGRGLVLSCAVTGHDDMLGTINVR
jgi:hypothetical protein